MGEAVAIFDVDGTLVRGRTEVLFFHYLWRRGNLSLGQVLAFLLGVAAAPAQRFRNKTYLRGMAAADAQDSGRRCYQERLAPRLRPAVLARLRAHQAQGRRIVLVTGSLSLLIKPLQEDLGADWLIATELAEQDGRFTGEILGAHPRGEQKRLLLEDLARRQGLDLSRSWAYGDHLEDAPLLAVVGHPVAVHPCRPLHRLARERGWAIEFC